ncbi:MAG: DinB family protein, partial [SAR202 cluster bacterium]|nr:DinB family protein [SAR202 cluster bacterium]
AQQNPTVWQRDDWHTRLGLPERDSGFGYTSEQVRDLPSFDIDQMLEYYDAVRVETFAFLDSLSESDLETEPHPRRPGYTIAEMFSHLMIEEAQHVGQVAYIRGIQRGLGK